MNFALLIVSLALVAPNVLGAPMESRAKEALEEVLKIQELVHNDEYDEAVHDADNVLRWMVEESKSDEKVAEYLYDLYYFRLEALLGAERWIEALASYRQALKLPDSDKIDFHLLDGEMKLIQDDSKKDSHDILAVDITASMDDIEAAYNRIIEFLHSLESDKVNVKDLVEQVESAHADLTKMSA